ncbi:MAG: GAF domain-containing protein [Bacteroidetes bacterium]|nr:GAF domain-containing protein [Bacteroidota bacterium]
MIKPNTEAQRLKALKKYEILDTPADGAYDRLVKIAAKMFNMPIALITLVDENRIWFKAKHGLKDVNEVPREPGLCASAILSDEVYLVENALKDPRTLANPLVCSNFGLRFYAAAPLKTKNGHNIGNFCIIDKKPRFLNKGQTELLQELANIVVDEFELRLSAIIEHRKQLDYIKSLEERLNSQTKKAG